MDKYIYVACTVVCVVLLVLALAIEAAASMG